MGQCPHWPWRRGAVGAIEVLRFALQMGQGDRQ